MSGPHSYARSPGPARVSQQAANGHKELTGETTSLSGADAAFLYLERKEIPLHIAAVTVFDGPIPFDEFVAGIESKLHLIPRYLQIAAPPALNVGYPVWHYDEKFDIRRHIFHTTVDAPGGEAELEVLAGKVLSQLMDRAKPLWDIHVVDGLAGRRGALIIRVHHALADGISVAALVNVMLDTTPQHPKSVGKPRFRAPRPGLAGGSLVDAVGSAVHSSLESLLTAEAGILELGQALFTETMQGGLPGVSGLLPELAASVERLPFNKSCGSQRRFCWAEFDFDQVQAVRAAVAGTVNDVVLTLLTRAIALYVKLHGETVVNRFLRVVCPVNARREGHSGTLGNRITFLPVALPMDVKDPVRMLREVAARTSIMKNSGAAELVALAGSWLGVAPPPIQAAIWRAIPNVTFPLPLFNIICTNVPGSPVPLYAAGRRMLASYPHMPTGYDLGIGCAVQSYAGKLSFGLTSDADAAPDANRLRDFIRVAFKELCRAAGVKAVRRPRDAKPKARKPAAPPADPAPPVDPPEAATEPAGAELAMKAEAGA